MKNQDETFRRFRPQSDIYFRTDKGQKIRHPTYTYISDEIVKGSNSSAVAFWKSFRNGAEASLMDFPSDVRRDGDYIESCDCEREIKRENKYKSRLYEQALSLCGKYASACVEKTRVFRERKWRKFDLVTFCLCCRCLAMR